MPEIIGCPDCGRKLRVPDDLLGRKVKCPGCGVTFTASGRGGGPPPLERAVGKAPRPRRRYEDEEDERPHRREEEEEYAEEDSERAKRRRWRRVRLGLTLVIIANWVIIGLMGLSLLTGLLSLVIGSSAASSPSAFGFGAAARGFGALGIIFLVLVVLGALAVMVLTLLGLGFGMAVPARRTYAIRPLAITSFALGAGGAGCYLLEQLLGLLDVYGGALAMAILSLLVWFASFVVFLFFLRSLCLAIRKDELASTVTTYMLSVLGLGVLIFLDFLFMVFVAGLSFDAGYGRSYGSASSAKSLAVLGFGLSCVTGLAALGLFIWYLVLLHRVRGAVDAHIRRL